ncbi:MAG TPA: zinc-binding dehydrogenase [Thermoanaerobaculia bacterium]|nr:zinc-binding dehydrogenase [Thermoanaerobaculia bacterium]
MRAVRLIAPGLPLEEREVPMPEVAAGEVLVEIRAAGVCHSDAHYRRGGPTLGLLPLTLGHEVAGVVREHGEGVERPQKGERVAIHYLRSCGICRACRVYGEQFCSTVAMIGKDIDGGYADFIAVPAMNALSLPEELSFAEGAVLMCSGATAFHALALADPAAGESIAIFGLGGLGIAAIQLAQRFSPGALFGVDVVDHKIALAIRLGAAGIDARNDSAAEIRLQTGGAGVDIAIELVGHPESMSAAVRSLAPKGRAVLAGISRQPIPFDPYRDLLGKEARIIGCSDHLRQELDELMELASQRVIDPGRIVSATIPLSAEAINETLDALDRGTAAVRTVIVRD